MLKESHLVPSSNTRQLRQGLQLLPTKPDGDKVKSEVKKDIMCSEKIYHKFLTQMFLVGPKYKTASIRKCKEDYHKTYIQNYVRASDTSSYKMS